MDAQQKADEGTLVLPKRKYQKRKTESKISVRHFLNPQVQVYNHLEEYGKYAHPLYVQTICRGKTNRFKSFLHLASNFESFDKLKQDYKTELEAEAIFFTDQIRSINFIHTDSPFSHEIAGWDMTDTVVKINTNIMKLIDDIYGSNIDKLKSFIQHNDGNEYYRSKLYDMTTVYNALDLFNRNLRSLDVKAIIPAVEIILFDKEEIKLLKQEFVTDPDFIEFLFDDTSLHTDSAKNTVTGWKSGLTQVYIRSWYRRKNDAHLCDLCERYITSVNNLLAKK